MLRLKTSKGVCYYYFPQQGYLFLFLLHFFDIGLVKKRGGFCHITKLIYKREQGLDNLFWLYTGAKSWCSCMMWHMQQCDVTPTCRPIGHHSPHPSCTSTDFDISLFMTFGTCAVFHYLYGACSAVFALSPLCYNLVKQCRLSCTVLKVSSVCAFTCLPGCRGDSNEGEQVREGHHSLWRTWNRSSGHKRWYSVNCLSFPSCQYLQWRCFGSPWSIFHLRIPHWCFVLSSLACLFPWPLRLPLSTPCASRNF